MSAQRLHMDLSGIISQSITARLQEHNNTNNKFVEVIQISFTNTSHIFCFESFFYSRNIPMQPFSEIWRQCIQIFLGVSGAWTLSCKCWRSSHLACDIYTTQFKTVALSFHNLDWREEREREKIHLTHIPEPFWSSSFLRQNETLYSKRLFLPRIGHVWPPSHESFR